MSMHVGTIFETLKQESARVVGFVLEGESYPLLFLSLLLTRTLPNVLLIDVQEQQEEHIKAQLETAFLGTTRTYRLIGLSAIPKAVSQQWLRYLSLYEGPNRILFDVGREIATLYAKESPQSFTFIELPASIQKNIFSELFAQCAHQPGILERRYIEAIYARTETIPLDTACLLIRYIQVLGSAAQDFFSHWIDKLVMPDTSLYTLSGYFFAKQPKQFLQIWSKIKKDYPEQFWISFWAEQLWRAQFYCKSMQQKNVAEAKKIGYRLPFSFLQKDYRNYSEQQLRNGHDELYALDYSLKNGGNELGLDLFLLRFFTPDNAKHS